MKKTVLVLFVLCSLAAACRERKADPRLDYDGVRSESEKAHESLDKEAGGD